MAINELLPFAVAPSANVMTQAEYVALTARAGGFVSGVAQSEQLNKVWRQAAFVAAMIGQYTANNSDEDVLDNGDVDTFEQNFALAVAATAVGSLPFATAAEVLAATLANRVVSPKTLAPAVQSGKWNYAVAAGTANALTVTLDPAPTSHAATVGTPLRVRITTMNTGPATLNAGPGALPIKTMRGNTLALGDLPLGSIVTLIGTGTDWVIDGIAYSDFRPILTANLDLYVATTGSDTANTGLSAASPFATLQRAWNYIQSRLDLNGYTVTVYVADGSYAGLVASGPVLGQYGAANVVFEGNVANPAACSIAQTNGSCFQSSGYAQFRARGFSMTASGTGVNQGFGVNCQGGVIVFDDVRFLGNTQAHVFAQNGVAQAIGTFTIAGASPMAFRAQGYGTIQISSQTCFVTGSPGIGVFASANNGEIGAVGTVFSASTTGKRYEATNGGRIGTNGAGANFFPGSAAGTVDSTSSYS